MNEKFREFLHKNNEAIKINPVDQDKLIHRINFSINNKIQHRKQFKIFGLSILSITSFSALIPVFLNLNTSLSQSGFYDYLIFFTDAEAISMYWKEISLILIESMPFMGIIILLGILSIFSWSITNIRKETKNVLKNIYA